MHSLPRDVQSLVFERLPCFPTRDVCAVDLVSKSWRAANANGGWKRVAKEAFGAGEWIKDAGVSWREALCAVVKPFVVRLRPMVSLKALEEKIESTVAQYDEQIAYVKRRIAHGDQLAEHQMLLFGLSGQRDDDFKMLQEGKALGWIPNSAGVRQLFEDYRDQAFPREVAGFLFAHTFFCGAPLESIQPFYRRRSRYVLTTDTDWNGKCEFLSLGTALFPWGDSQWWFYAVISGSVKCAMAPKNYHKSDHGPYGPVRDFGPGSVVAFCLANHGDCQWDAEHVPPPWADLCDEFGHTPKFEESQMDQWVRVCIQKPIEASKDSVPCGWPSMAAFLDEVDSSWEYAKPWGRGFRLISKEEALTLTSVDNKGDDADDSESE